MGIMVGVTTNKFLMIAAAMCFPARIDHETVHAAIDANVPSSVISPKMAQRLHIFPRDGGGETTLGRPIHISIGAEEFSVSAIAVSDSPFDDGAHPGTDLILGNDILQTHIFDVDFPHKIIRLVPATDGSPHGRAFQPVPVTRDGRGNTHAGARVGDGPADAVLDLGSDMAITVVGPHHGGGIDAVPVVSEDVSLGDIRIGQIAVPKTEAGMASAAVRIGMSALESHHVIFDFPDGKIWLQK